MIRIGCLFLLVLSISIPSPALGQPEPYSEMEVWGGVVFPGQDGALSNYWEPGLGGAAGLATPFFSGRLIGSLRLVPYSPRSSVPSFRALNLRAGWDTTLLAYGPATVRGSVHVGNLRMSFDDSGSEPGIRNESEFAAGYGAGLFLDIGSSSGIALTVTQERVFTRKPLELRHWALAYTHRFATPDWLRRWIE